MFSVADSLGCHSTIPGPLPSTWFAQPPYRLADNLGQAVDWDVEFEADLDALRLLLKTVRGTRRNQVRKSADMYQSLYNGVPSYLKAALAVASRRVTR